MTTSCGARSCFSIFPSYDLGPPTLPVWPEFVSESQSREEASRQDTRGAHFRCRDNSISFHHALVSTARPRTRVRGLSIGAVFRQLGRGALSRIGGSNCA